MSINFRIIAFWTALFLCTSQTTAFWWSRSDTPTQEPPNPYAMPSMPMYYQQRVLKTQPHSYQMPPDQNQGGQVAVPAIPIQMPLQAQLAHVPNIHNVQLVPCLCPVTPEEFEKHDQSHNNIKNTV